ncbi:hypothetical protein AB0K16_59420 [Nonomuraea jabiensis]
MAAIAASSAVLASACPMSPIRMASTAFCARPSLSSSGEPPL